jgi:tetratricopeptide (TPR) repeat protein
MIDSNSRKRLERFALQSRAGAFDEALAQIDELISEHPDQAPLHWHRVKTLKALDRQAEALQAVARVIELRADHAPAWLEQAELGLSTGTRPDPEPDLRRALKLDPRLPHAHLLLARCLAQRGARDQALVALTQAFELDPNPHEAYRERAEWHRRDARVGFGDDGPEDPDVILTVSGQRLSRSKLQAARDDYRRSLELKNVPRVRLSLAAVLHELGEHEDAVAAFDAVLAVTPTDDPHREAIVDMRARSVDGGRGEHEEMASLLENALAQADAGSRRTVEHALAASMIHSTAAAIRSGLSLQQAMAQFVSDHPDDIRAIDIAYKVYALAFEPEPAYLASAIAGYPEFMREHAEKVSAALGAQGFTVIGDFEPTHLAAQLSGPTLVRIYASSDGISCGASYRVEPKWPGWLAWLVLKLKGKWQRPAVVELESAFDDGGFLITNNAGSSSPFAYRGQIDLCTLAPDTPPAVLYSRHRERIEHYRSEHPHATAERLDSAESILAMQVRIRDAKCRFRQSIGYFEENELRQLLGAEYGRLGPRVRDKLELMIKAGAES